MTALHQKVIDLEKAKQDAIILNGLMPGLAIQDRIESSVTHSEKNGEKKRKSKQRAKSSLTPFTFVSTFEA